MTTQPSKPTHNSQLKPVSLHFPLSATSAAANRRVAIAVDLSDESAYAVKWAVQNYLRPGDAVILLHVRPTSVLYGADWGFSPSNKQQKIEQDYDNLTNTKATQLAVPLVEANVPYKIHIVKDRDMKERLCLEVERLGLSAMIMGSRGFGATSSEFVSKGKLGSVSDYCVHNCICPVVVVRYPQEDENDGGGVEKKAVVEAELPPVPEEEVEYHDADDELTKGG
ncbi:PREDICTED: universal stress protein PHOS32-like [Nicotiana attenuata]|uniref:Universal stress protein phos32 n=1 Tax=Nicotiana attenuata TaxID=49451 RepID=A0A1J6I4Z0_NICAT|nr:PREDICTED: universal stress protein PHOS32-like [Nicotiana attenuata]OIT00093.1 universal stress protein phos32 [Nicotiana attenuata]